MFINNYYIQGLAGSPAVVATGWAAARLMPLSLSLALFVFWVLANNHHFAVAFDDFAFFTNRFYRRSNLHNSLSPLLCSYSCAN